MARTLGSQSELLIVEKALQTEPRPRPRAYPDQPSSLGNNHNMLVLREPVERTDL
jgi:hypothetical protein